ncbi:MAG: hypothetical protein J5899_03440 [Acidaminococcaceae bacterium]|nr:hypothetical protein [Acidaminococcaceae bacterium]
MEKLTTLAFKLTPAQKADAEVMATIRGASLSEYVRNLVYQDCKKNAEKIAEYREMLKKMNE